MPSFLKMTGSQKGVIKADVQVPKHKEEIEITSWSQSIEYKKIELSSGIKESIKDIEKDLKKNRYINKENKKQIDDRIAQLDTFKNNFYAKKSGNSWEFLQSIQKWHSDTALLINTIQNKNKALIPKLKTQIAQLNAAAHLAENDNLQNPQEVIAHFSLYKTLVHMVDTEVSGGKVNVSHIAQQQPSLFSEKAEELAEHAAFEFEKRIDSASPLLLDMCSSGEKITECVFSMYRPISSNEANGDLIAELNLYMRVTLRNAYIGAYQIKQSDDNELPMEDISINYDEAEFVFVEGNVLIGKRGIVKSPLKLDWRI
jgi:type VI secretion system Hcp family effector